MVELTGKGHVLVVDDDETIVAIVEKILGEAGYETLPAYDGEQALDIFATNKVDLVVTDICMDGMDGFELIKRIRLVDSTTNIIVMTTRRIRLPAKTAGQQRCTARIRRPSPFQRQSEIRKQPVAAAT